MGSREVRVDLLLQEDEMWIREEDMPVVEGGAKSVRKKEYESDESGGYGTASEEEDGSSDSA